MRLLVLFLYAIVALPLSAMTREAYIEDLKNVKMLQLFGKVNLGGAWTYKYELAKMLRGFGFKLTCMVSDLDKRNQLKHEGFDVLPTGPVSNSYTESVKQLSDSLLAACKKHKFKLVHCHMPEEVEAAHSVAQQLPIKIVVTTHSMFPHVYETTRYADGVAAISPIMMPHVRAQLSESPLAHVEWVCPFFQDSKIIKLKKTESREDFFKKNFGFALTNDPLICSVAHFYRIGKNHEVLLQAFKRILYQHKLRAQLVLVGGGSRLEEMKALAGKLGLRNHVFFTGATPLAPEIMMHSDIKALTSDLEGLSIALLEAALLKKPLIGTAGTGMEGLIVNNYTGLLFKKRDDADLALKLVQLIKNPQDRKRLGENAYNFVTQHCCRVISEYKILKLYHDVLNTKAPA